MYKYINTAVQIRRQLIKIQNTDLRRLSTQLVITVHPSSSIDVLVHSPTLLLLQPNSNYVPVAVLLLHPHSITLRTVKIIIRVPENSCPLRGSIVKSLCSSRCCHRRLLFGHSIFITWFCQNTSTPHHTLRLQSIHMSLLHVQSVHGAPVHVLEARHVHIG